MVKSFVYSVDAKEDAQDAIREWFHNDKRVSFRLDDAILNEKSGDTVVIPMLVAIVPAFSDGNLYAFYSIRPGDTVSVTRQDTWPVISVVSGEPDERTNH